MISARNTILPGNNCDLHDAIGKPVLKPTMDATGQWITRPAAEIDHPHDPRVIRASIRSAIAAGLNLDLYDHPERTDV